MADRSGTSKSTARTPRVVILGGGFAGIEAAKVLDRARVPVTLVDRRNYHLFQPLLYQVATAALNPANIASPIRFIFKGSKYVEVILADVVAIDVTDRRVRLTDGELVFDYLIVATGATHSYFGHEEWEAFAPGLKSIEDATAIRRKILLAYEAAERETDPIRKRDWLTFVVVGAGPTGVELAGQLAEIAHRDFNNEYKNVIPSESRVILVEAGPYVLAAYPQELSESARSQLGQLGVEVRTSAMVTAVSDQGVTTNEGPIPAKTVLWAAGVQASPLAKTLGAPLDRAGRVRVEPDLSVPGASEIFVVGDLAAIENDGQLIPGVAQAAIQGGRHAANMIAATIQGKPRSPFRYRDKGTLATIGRHKAVGVVGRFRLKGIIAWLAWGLVHVFFLIGFRNKIQVMAEWIWLYLFHNRGSRLITGPVEDLLNLSHDE